MQTAPRLQSNCVFDLRINPKQQVFFNEVFSAIAGKSKNRYFFYGGAVRGGKTAVCLTILILLAKKYPNSRWHIIRDSFTTLEGTTIPSFEKFCPENSPSVLRYNRNRANYFVEFRNGSKIFFASESYYQDKELTWMLGLETNGIMLEQVEGINEKTWQKALERCGSWYINPMPPGLILSTFNPTLSWVKEKIYEPYQKGDLTTPYYFLQALPSDNPLVTEDQWNAWKQMDDISYKRFVEGDWSAFAVEKPFCYAFDYSKHVGKCEFNPNYDLKLSFDFNKDPITAGAIQDYDNKIRVIKAFKLSNSNIYELCDHIRATFPNALFLVTGDETGNHGTALVKDNINYYTIIKQRLGLISTQIKVAGKNPPIDENRVLVNSVFQHVDIVFDEIEAKALIYDCSNVQVDDYGAIMKDRSNEARKADSLDWWRYYLNTFQKFRLKMHGS